jgi:hypothetical protein
MIEWWQTLLISWGGSLVVGALAVVIHVRTARENRAAEERRAKRKVEEEQRQTIRQIRRERVQPIFDFLELAKQYFASATIERVVDGSYDGRSNIKDGMTLERWRERVKDVFPEGFLGELDDLQLLRALSIAVATASTEEIQNQVMEVFEGLKPVGQPLKLDYTAAITAAEELVERYVAGIKPAETPAEARE